MGKIREKLVENQTRDLDDLKRLARIPSVSFPGFPQEKVRESAQAVAALLKERGLENVELLELPGAHPYVYGDWLHGGPEAPTVLLYAHHDVQPPGREEVWETEPFTPTEKESPQGLRLYGRGTADDKAGVIVHTSAISAYLETVGKLPINVKVLIEGEEEIGSGHLLEFLKKYREKLDANVLVLTDTLNFDCGVPSLTVALRGVVGIEVELKSLTKTVHSGMWGGPVPDPAMGLSKLLAGLVDDNGVIQIPEILQDIPTIPPESRRDLEQLPFDEKKFRDQCGMLESTRLIQANTSPYELLWYRPSMNINAIEVNSRDQAGNVINDSAWAKITLRVPPGMDPHRVQNAVVNHLRTHTLWGLEINIKTEEAAGGWSTNPRDGKQAWAFEAGVSALETGYGKGAVFMGCGGTIPFVEPFAQALGGAPALMIGVEDPHTNAHGENESLLIEDFKKACHSQVCLFQELAERFPRP